MAGQPIVPKCAGPGNARGSPRLAWRRRPRPMQAGTRKPRGMWFFALCAVLKYGVLSFQGKRLAR
jgi:hypothetical protein